MHGPTSKQKRAPSHRDGTREVPRCHPGWTGLVMCPVPLIPGYGPTLRVQGGRYPGPVTGATGPALLASTGVGAGGYPGPFTLIVAGGLAPHPHKGRPASLWSTTLRATPPGSALPKLALCIPERGEAVKGETRECSKNEGLSAARGPDRTRYRKGERKKTRSGFAAACFLFLFSCGPGAR